MAIEFGKQPSCPFQVEGGLSRMAINLDLFSSAGANNTQTQNFNSLILQLLSQIKLIKEQDYKG
jgi:hypothetical protein